MFDRVCLVHYHELGLKGHNRYRFERQLRDNLEAALDFFVGTYTFAKDAQRISGRFVIAVSEDALQEVGEYLAEVPGVARVSLAFKTGRSVEEMQKASALALSEVEPFQTFKVAARRANTDFKTPSMELNKVIGTYLTTNFPDKQVKMKSPDATVRVEVIQGAAYVYAKTIKGAGGLPVGSGGRIVSLLSSGIDSPVATWRMIRRGAVVVGVHFSGRPQTADTSERIVRELGHVLERTNGLARIYIIPFGDIQKEIAMVSPPELRILLYRRLMVAISERIARAEKAKALITGESLGQVASQTLANIQCVDAVASLPILRPLIGNDKQEIIDEARRIGTFELSTQDSSDCCTLFMPRNPETHGKLSVVNAAYAALPVDEMIQKAIDSMEWVDYRCVSGSEPTKF